MYYKLGADGVMESEQTDNHQIEMTLSAPGNNDVPIPTLESNGEFNLVDILRQL